VIFITWLFVSEQNKQPLMAEEKRPCGIFLSICNKAAQKRGLI